MVPDSGSSRPVSSSAPPRSAGIVRCAGSGRAWAAAALTAAVLLCLALWVDRPLALWVRQVVSPGVDAFFAAVGQLGDIEEGYVVAALLTYALSLAGMAGGWTCPWRTGFAWLARASMLLLSTLACGGLLTLVLKHVVARARPELLFEHGIYGLSMPFAGGEFKSFPSGHTLAAFGVAVVVGIVAPRWRWPVLCLAAAVAVSRIVNLEHYLSDVLGSACIAFTVAYGLAPRVMDPARQWPLRAPWHWWLRG